MEYNVIRCSLGTTGVLAICAFRFGAPASMGILLGGVIATLIFYHLTIDVHNLLAAISGSPARRAWRGYAQRYLLNGAAMAAALNSPHISFAAAIIGLLIPKGVILFITFAGRRR